MVSINIQKSDRITSNNAKKYFKVDFNQVYYSSCSILITKLLFKISNFFFFWYIMYQSVVFIQGFFLSKKKYKYTIYLLELYLVLYQAFCDYWKLFGIKRIYTMINLQLEQIDDIKTVAKSFSIIRGTIIRIFF